VFQPALAAAAAAVQSWLAAQGGLTLGEALASSCSTTIAAKQCSHHAAEASSRETPQPSQAPAACVDGAHKQCDPAISGAEAIAEADVDYIALAALKGALRPKLCFVSGGGGGSPPGLR
jgi:hypothetical protein